VNHPDSADYCDVDWQGLTKKVALARKLNQSRPLEKDFCNLFVFGLTYEVFRVSA